MYRCVSVRSDRQTGLNINSRLAFQLCTTKIPSPFLVRCTLELTYSATNAIRKSAVLVRRSARDPSLFFFLFSSAPSLQCRSHSRLLPPFTCSSAHLPVRLPLSFLALHEHDFDFQFRKVHRMDSSARPELSTVAPSFPPDAAQLQLFAAKIPLKRGDRRLSPGSELNKHTSEPVVKPPNSSLCTMRRRCACVRLRRALPTACMSMS